MEELSVKRRYSEVQVYPSNYLSKHADVSLTWCVRYRYYNELYPKGKQIVLKTMNRITNLKEKQQHTLDLYRQEVLRLEQGYDPTKRVTPAPVRKTLFECLSYAAENLTVIEKTRKEIISMVKRIKKYSPKLDPPITEATRKVFKQILDNCYQNPKYTDNTFNHYRKYLGMLVVYLIEAEIIEVNPIREIKKKATVSKLKEILTNQERTLMETHLKKNYYTFWRFVQIFLYSGSRIAELLRVTKEDVYLDQQMVKITIIKGKNRREVLKVIPNKVLPLWKELLNEPGEPCMFSRHLKPGKKAVREEQIHRRWHSHVKIKLKMDIDMYSLKHLYLDSLDKHFDLKTASAAADHTETGVTRKFYTVGRDKRIREKLKTFEI